MPRRGEDLYDAGIAERLEAMVEAGDVKGMLTTMFRDLVQMPAAEIELLRSQRAAWAVRLANAPTLPRELRTEMGYLFDPTRFRNVQTPTLLLVGGDSPPHT